MAYDGFGQLIQQQSPRQGWETTLHGCSEVENRLETVVDYGYDGLGRLLRTSVPRAVAFNWVHEADWDAGYSATTYDGLSRPVSTIAPNGSMTTFHYNGLTSSVIGGSRGEDERRMLSWQRQDQMGRTTLLRSYTPGGDEWTLAAEISLTYDAADQLTQVYRRDGGERRWQRTSSVGYDFLGRKTGMSDADLGNWSYAYNTLGQLMRQTDARDQTSCLYYDSLGRMRGRVQRTDESCAATVADVDLGSSYSYDPQGRVQSVAHGLVSRSYSYDSYSRLNGETVTIDNLTRASSYSYDSYHRPTAVTYHGGEVVTTEYGSPGVAVGLSSSVHGELVDNVSYDEAGRMTALRLPAAGGLWRTQSYYPWTVRRNGGMLESLKVGLSEGGGERLSRSYAYNSFGDLTALTEETTSYSFSYDGLGRLTSAYGRTYSYDGANRLTTFNGQTYNYYDAGPYHAVDRIGDFDRLDYDANGNMVTRNKGLDSQQTLVWNAENRLSQVQDNDGDVVERYWYDVGGSRVKKTSGTTTTYTFFGHYEEEVTGGVTTAISHYSFGGLRIAVKRGSALYHLHGDHLGSTSLTTAGSVVEASRAYYAYGSERSASGDLRTDRTFTGQKSDATGLLYYNARYYDPALGTFISPDTIVPDPGRLIDYNRFLYVRGNPLKYTDPSRHCPPCVWLLFAALILGGSTAQEPAGPYSHTPDNDNGRLAVSILPVIGDANDLATVVTGRDYLMEEDVPYFSPGWFLTGVAAVLPVVSGKVARLANAVTPARRAGSRFIPELDQVVNGQVVRTIPTAKPLPTGVKNKLRREARNIWEAANDRKLSEGEQVHHRVPLEWAHLTPDADPNRLANLREMTVHDHTQVNRAWTAFKTQHRRMGTTPTAAQVLHEALRIDELY